MTLSSAIRCVLIIGAFLTSQQEHVVLVQTVVKVNDLTKDINGEKYHLVGIRSDPRGTLGITDTVGVGTVINGELGHRLIRPPAQDEIPPGKRVPGIAIVWLRLPREGRLEYLSGLVRMPSSDPVELHKQLLDAGYGSFTVDVNQIPVVRANTMEALMEAMNKIVTPATQPTTTQPASRH